MKSRIGKTVEANGELYLTCEEVITFLLDYLTSELSPEEQVEFDRHFAICPSCRAYLDSYRRAVLLGRDAMRGEIEEMPPALAAELVRALERARG